MAEGFRSWAEKFLGLDAWFGGGEEVIDAEEVGGDEWTLDGDITDMGEERTDALSQLFNIDMNTICVFIINLIIHTLVRVT